MGQRPKVRSAMTRPTTQLPVLRMKVRYSGMHWATENRLSLLDTSAVVGEPAGGPGGSARAFASGLAARVRLVD